MSETEAKIWLQRAASNLQLAQRGRGQGVLFEDLCFEAQQATEKSLKALLIFLTGDFPKVHSIGLLLQRIEEHIPVSDAIKEAVDLTDYAVQFRYPGDYAPVSKEEYQQAVELAARTLEWVEQQIK